jgi:hypothetical protein
MLDRDFLKVALMRTLLSTFLCVFLGTGLAAFEGKLEYRIHSGEREWRMVTLIKGEYSRSDVYLGDTHFQSILRSREGTLLVDELNRQVFQADFEREKWGRPGEPEVKTRSEARFVTEPRFQRDGLSGGTYVIKARRQDVVIEIAEGIGVVPGVFIDQFASLRELNPDGQLLFDQHPGVPVRIYPRRQDRKPLLELISRVEQPVDASIFEIGDGYVRAKMRFKMR